MAHGATSIRIIQDADARPDYESILAQLRKLPGVVTAAVVWENETLDETDEGLLDGSSGNPALSPVLKQRLMR